MTTELSTELLSRLRELPDPAELADALWLAPHLPVGPASTPSQGPPPPEPTATASTASVRGPGTAPGEEASPGGRAVDSERATLHVPSTGLVRGGRPFGLPIRAPTVPALPNTLELIRALRPLCRTTDSWTDQILDEEATSVLAADLDLWLPEFKAAPEPWLDLALVVDDSASMVIWRRATAELRTLLERLGAFRDVRTWRLRTDGTSLAVHGAAAPAAPRGRNPTELIDPTGRRLILVVTDCIAPAWGTERMRALLARWGTASPLAIVQLLPHRLWRRCSAEVTAVRLRAGQPGLPNARLEVRPAHLREAGFRGGIAVPVVELDARWLRPLASLVAGAPGGPVEHLAILTGRTGPANPPGLAASPSTMAPGALHPDQHVAGSAADRLRQFRALASPTALQLARYLAAAPLSLPVMRLVQGVMLPRTRPSHLAEVFLGGVLRQVTPRPHRLHPDEVEYDFHPGLRELLLVGVPRTDALLVLSRVSDYVSSRMGTTVDFRAALAAEDARAVGQLGRPFAEVAYTVLRALGGRHASFADRSRVHALARPALMADPGPQLGRRDRARRTSIATGLSTKTRTTPGDDVTTPDTPDLALPDDRGEPRSMVWEGVPSRNPNFTGRRELLRRLREELTSGVTAVLPQALHGSGGVGKTHLAIEYAHRYAADYDLVWWVPAEHQVPLRSSLAALARVLKVPESTDINRTLAAVREALTAGEPYRRWLLVFDNADEPGELRQYLPSGPGHTLVTSRNERWADEARGALKVDVFTRVESVQFLRQRGHAISAEDADRLATALGDLPLALEHAAALQAETEITVDEYLRRFTERQDQLIRTGSASDYPNTVVVTLGLAIEGLQMKAPAALQLLELCAFLAPEPVWFSLLLAGNWVTDLPPPLLAIVQDERKLKSAIVQIDRYGLARVDTAGKNLQVHRYVRELLLNRLTEGQRAGHRRSVHELLSVYNMVAGEPSDPDNWDHYARLYPHMLAADAIEGPDPKVRKVVLDMVRNLYSRGDYDSSRELARSAIDRWTETLGPDDEQTLIMSYHLGCTLRAAGNSAAAREINKRTLARLSQVCGEDDAYTLDTANSVGADLRLLGEFQDARALDQDTLTRSRREFGEVDPSTMRSANNLAVDLRLLGEFSAALQVDKDTLRGRRLLFPGPHPETMMSVNNLARDHYELGNYTEARAALEDALATPSQRLGEDHPAALLARLTYAMVLRKVGEYENAYDQAARTLRLYQRKFGDSTPDTYAAMVTLANAAREAGDPTRARELCAAAHDGLGQTLGLEHSLTLHAAVDLGVALRTLRRHEEARQIDEQALNILVRVGDADRPFTLAAAVGLANDLYLAEEYTQARRWSEDTVARSTRVRGNDHPYTLAATYNLAVDLRATGDSVGADRLLTETVRRFARSQLGGDGEPMAAVGSPRAECDIDLLPT